MEYHPTQVRPWSADQYLHNAILTQERGVCGGEYYVLNVQFSVYVMGYEQDEDSLFVLVVITLGC